MRNSDYKNHIIFSYLKDLPSDWRVLPNRAIFKERIERGFEDKNLLSVTIEKGIISQEELIESTSKKDSSNEDKSNYKLVKVNDIAYNKMRMWQGAVGYSQFEGIVSPAYVILRPIADINSRYYHYLFRTNLYNTYSYTYSYGISNDTLSLRWDEFKRMFSIIPPRKEQDAIVKYLDEKIADIDKYISAKQNLIKLLDEQISGIVLRGFNSKKLDWSLNWLNGIPESWVKQKAKWIFNEIKVYNKPEEQLLAVTQDRGVLPKDLCENNFVSPSGSLVGLKLVEENDFVISLRSFQGGIEYSKYRGIVSPAYNVIRLNSQYNNSSLIKYYQYLFKTKRFIQLLNTIISGIRDGKNINFSDFSNLILPIPTSEDLAKMIKYFSQFELLKEKFEKEKILLKELSSSLIAEAVSGKLKNIYK